MKISHVLGIAGIAFLAAISPAAAASVPSPSAVTVKVGGSMQSNGSATSGLAAGVDYNFHPASALEPVNVSFYADLLGSSVGAGLGVRTPGPIYAGAGLGLYSVSEDSESATGLGGKIFAGFDIAPRTTLELGYNFLPQVEGRQNNAVTLALGLHL